MNTFVALVILLIVAAIYFTPMMVANYRHKKDLNSITVLNVLLGWTLIGWVIALIWAFKQD